MAHCSVRQLLVIISLQLWRIIGLLPLASGSQGVLRIGGMGVRVCCSQ